jgi:ParB/RepB/Spo0J family partition protein
MNKKRETILSGLNLNSIREGTGSTPSPSAMIMPRATDYKREIAQQSDRIAEVLGADKADALLKSENLVLLDPSKVRMWALADRDQENLNKKECADLIESMRAVGQVIPCIGRPIEGSEHAVEFIVGARRLFSAQVIANNNKDFRIMAYVKPINDLEAFKIMDAENRVREDISDWARARSYQNVIESGQFKGREHLATQLGMPTAKLSKLLAFFDLPAQLSDAFPNKPSFRANWAYELLRGYRKLEKNEKAQDAVFKKAAALRARQLDKTAKKKHRIGQEDVYRVLLREIEHHIMKQTTEDQEPSVIGYRKQYSGFTLSVSNKGRMSFLFENTIDRKHVEQAAKAVEKILGGEGEVSPRK